MAVDESTRYLEMPSSDIEVDSLCCVRHDVEEILHEELNCASVSGVDRKKL